MGAVLPPAGQALNHPLLRWPHHMYESITRLGPVSKQESHARGRQE
jgi:hypothetical protein